MKQTEPLISVIIPVFNGEKYITQTLESILIQDYDPIEVIVINDGSTDRTGDILINFSSRLHIVNQDNTGVSAARNRGIELAQGELIVFFDSDDLMYPGKLSDQALWLDQHPSLGYVHSGWDRIDANDEHISSIRPWRYAPCLDLETWLVKSPVYLGAMMFCREWVERVGKFDPNLTQSEDTEWIYRLALLGCPGGWLRRSTAGYRYHKASATQNIPQAMHFINRVRREFLARPDIPEEILQKKDDLLYNTLIWSASRLFQAGYTDEIAPYLHQSRTFRDAPPVRMLTNWLAHMILNCGFTEIEEMEQLYSLKPVFRTVLEVDEHRWKELERLMDLIFKAEMIRKSRNLTR